jgi:hypothetical protein
MKKSILSASIAAMIGGLGLAGAANAAVFTHQTTPATGLATPDNGIGHILIVPYFTTQGTNATLLNIVNTDTTNAKAVKVRFRGASNSDDLFDFTLLLSPGDVWAAKVSQGSDGISRLETSDKSCTLPAAVGTQANSFGTSRLNPALTAAQLANETREGYIEILTMADIPRFANADQAAAAVTGVTAGVSTSAMWTAVKHVNGVAPCTTAVLGALGTDPTTYSNTATAATAALTAQGKGLDFPTGGLFANYTIIDTVKTATYSGEATALVANGGTANLVFFPQTGTTVATSPVSTALNVVTNSGINALTADPLLITNSLRAVNGAAPAAGTSSLITPLWVDLPDLSTPYYGVGAGVAVSPVQQAIALSNRLAAKSTINEFLTTTSIAATTDWVFSMPTRRYNVAMNYAYTSPLGGDGRVYTDFGTGANYFTSANTSVSNGRICVNADAQVARDREETVQTGGFVISPATVTVVRFCGETSVLAINNGTNTSSGSLSSSLATQNVTLAYNEGYLALTHNGLDTAARGAGAWPDPVAAATGTARGLPVVGASFAKSSAFGAAWQHRFGR